MCELYVICVFNTKLYVARQLLQLTWIIVRGYRLRFYFVWLFWPP